MSGYASSSTKKDSERYKYKNISTCAFLLILILLPIVIHSKVTKITGSLLLYFPSQHGNANDLSIYYKAVLLIIITAALVLFFIGERIFTDKKADSPLIKNRSNRPFIILAGIYCLFVLISMMLSSNQETALGGAPNSYESTFVLICYMAIFLLAINYFDDDYNISAVMKALPFLFLFLIFYGFIEYFYKNPYQIRAFQYLILSPSMWGYAGKLSFNGYRGNIFLTFANSDYAGEFMALFIPLSFILIKHSTGIHKAVNIFISAGLMLMLLLSGSAASIYAIVAEVVILAFIYRRILLKSWKSIVTVAVLFVIMATLFSAVKGETVFSTFVKKNTGSTLKMNHAVYHVDNIQLGKSSVFFDSGKKKFIVIVSDKGYSFIDENGRQIDSIRSGNKYTFAEPDYKAIKITYKNIVFSVDLGYSKPVSFAYMKGRVYGVGPNYTLISQTSDSSGFGFKNMQSFATGRGYIWRKSLPLLSHTLLTGFGADCSVFHIPQNDYAGKLNYQGSVSLVIDKPHNAYLQTAINCGLPAMLALLLILILYAVMTLKILRKGSYSQQAEQELPNSQQVPKAQANQRLTKAQRAQQAQQVQQEKQAQFARQSKIMQHHCYDYTAAIFACTVGFAICAFFYDSSVSTTPLFWMLLGMGIATGKKCVPENSEGSEDTVSLGSAGEISPTKQH